MRLWIFTSFCLFCSWVVAGETSCPTISIHTGPAIKSYRIDGGKCRDINQGIVETGQDSKQLTFFGISHCRIFPTLPNSCDVRVADLLSADNNGNCEVGVEWTFIPHKGASCSAVDR